MSPEGQFSLGTGTRPAPSLASSQIYLPDLARQSNPAVRRDVTALETGRVQSALGGAGSWRFALSEWLGQLFGNCPFEEVLFRGFLLPQCLLLTKHWIPESRRWKHLAIALLLSRGYFALCHVFFNLHQPEGQWLLIAQFVFGLLFAAIYLSTGNLFVAIGIHALVNNPAPLLKDPLPGPGVTGSIVLVGCLIWLCVLPWRNKMQPNLLQSNDD